MKEFKKKEKKVFGLYIMYIRQICKPSEYGVLFSGISEITTLEVVWTSAKYTKCSTPEEVFCWQLWHVYGP